MIELFDCGLCEIIGVKFMVEGYDVWDGSGVWSVVLVFVCVIYFVWGWWCVFD